MTEIKKGRVKIIGGVAYGEGSTPPDPKKAAKPESEGSEEGHNKKSTSKKGK
jgi:hypothetical protein